MHHSDPVLIHYLLRNSDYLNDIDTDFLGQNSLPAHHLLWHQNATTNTPFQAIFWTGQSRPR